jgi:hypothetical protein
MVATPSATGVTVPLELTAAMAGLELDQVIVRPVTASPFGPTSCTAIVRVVVNAKSMLSGVTTIAETGGTSVGSVQATAPARLVSMAMTPSRARVAKVDFACKRLRPMVRCSIWLTGVVLSRPL